MLKGSSSELHQVASLGHIARRLWLVVQACIAQAARGLEYTLLTYCDQTLLLGMLSLQTYATRGLLGG